MKDLDAPSPSSSYSHQEPPPLTTRRSFDALPDCAQEATVSFSEEDQRFKLRLVSSSVRTYYGGKLPKIILRQARSSVLSLVALMDQQCLQELYIGCTGLLVFLIPILSRGQCQSLKKISFCNPFHGIEVSRNELDTLATTIEMGVLPALEAIHLSHIYSMRKGPVIPIPFVHRPRSFSVDGLKSLFGMALPFLPCFRSLRLPVWMTNVDTEALADALGARHQSGLQGLTELEGLTDRYMMVGHGGESVQDPLPHQKLEFIARISKICLPTTEELNLGGRWDGRIDDRLKAAGKILGCSPALALKKLQVCSETVREEPSFFPLLQAIAQGNTPVLEELDLRQAAIIGSAVDYLCAAIEGGALQFWKKLSFFYSIRVDADVIKIAEARARPSHRFPRLRSLSLDGCHVEEVV